MNEEKRSANDLAREAADCIEIAGLSGEVLRLYLAAWITDCADDGDLDAMRASSNETHRRYRTALSAPDGAGRGAVKGRGSEPKLSKRVGEEGTLEWGRWTFTVTVNLVPYAGSLYYVGVVDVCGGGDDGESGMAGQLTTSPQASLDAVASEVRTSMRMTVRSEHMEDGDEDQCVYERTIDLGPAIDQACALMREAEGEVPRS